MSSITEKKFTNALALTGKIGPRGFAKLCGRFSSLEEAWQAPAGELTSAGFSPKDAGEIVQRRASIDPDTEWQKLDASDIIVTTLEDDTYPDTLRTIADPPYMLYRRGAPFVAGEKLLAIVGTRRPTAYGKEVAGFFARELTRAGFSIVSGMADGIDTIAHTTALEEGARTYAVLGSGLDVIYPQTNRRLAERIAASGALISEFPLSTPPLKQHFPQRNRIISGLSMGTLVVEARVKSGALITGELALEQGREVFAVPGPIFSKASGGTNRLIQQGAKLVEDVNDVLSEFGFEAEGRVGTSYTPRHPEEHTLLEFLAEEPKHLDVIVRETNLKISEVHTTLTLLEVNDVVEHLGGNIYTVKKSHGV